MGEAVSASALVTARVLELVSVQDSAREWELASETAPGLLA
jgi:hypothetical protein